MYSTVDPLELRNVIFKPIGYVLELRPKLSPLSNFILDSIIAGAGNVHTGASLHLMQQIRQPLQYYKEYVVSTGSYLVHVSCTSQIRDRLIHCLIISGYNYIINNLNVHEDEAHLLCYKEKLRVLGNPSWSIPCLDDDADEPILSQELIKLIVLHLQFVELYRFYQTSKQYRQVIDSPEVIKLLITKWLPDLKVSVISTYTELFITYTLTVGPTIADMEICTKMMDYAKCAKLAINAQDVYALKYLCNEGHMPSINVNKRLRLALDDNNMELVEWILQTHHSDIIVYIAVEYYAKYDTRLYNLLDVYNRRQVLDNVALSTTSDLQLLKRYMSDVVNVSIVCGLQNIIGNISKTELVSLYNNITSNALLTDSMKLSTVAADKVHEQAALQMQMIRPTV